MTGAATAAELALRGARVLGLDRWSPPHQLGSSHGDTRITREAYYEKPFYVPLVRRARQHWLALERATGRNLFLETGGLNVGAPDSGLVVGALASARAHGVEHEILTAAGIRRRFPGLCPRDGMLGVYEPHAGVLFPEACVTALHQRAGSLGADLRCDERVSGWTARADGIDLATETGSYRASKLVVAAGAWLPALIPGLEIPLQVERQMTAWFEHDGSYAAACSPVTLWELTNGTVFFTCPDVGAGMKAGFHHGGRIVDAELVQITISSSTRCPTMRSS